MDHAMLRLTVMRVVWCSVHDLYDRHGVMPSLEPQLGIASSVIGGSQLRFIRLVLYSRNVTMTLRRHWDGGASRGELHVAVLSAKFQLHAGPFHGQNQKIATERGPPFLRLRMPEAVNGGTDDSTVCPPLPGWFSSTWTIVLLHHACCPTRHPLKSFKSPSLCL